MGEIQSHFRLTQRRETPFRLMMGVHIEDGFLAVVQMVAEIKERVRMAERSADVAVIGFRGIEARRLGEQGMEGSRRLHIRAELRVLHFRRLNLGLYNRRFGGHFACRLNHRLEIALYGHRPVESRVLLRENRGAKDRHDRYTDIPIYRYIEFILHFLPPFLRVCLIHRVLPAVG